MGGRKPTGQSEGEGSARRGSNFEPDKTKSFVDRIELLKDEIQLHKDACKATCEPINEDIKEIYEEAENAGIPPDILKAAVKRRKLHRDAEKLEEKFQGGRKDEYHALLLALGELGKAAVRADA